MRIPSILLSLLLTLALGEGALAGTSYARAGWVADLTTRSHGVSGRVTILDAETLLVENFNYDGGGISVFFYLGATDNNAAFSVGAGIGPQLFGTPYSNATLTLRLPQGVNLDNYGAISVWCEVAGANFGSDAFSAPTTPRLILSALPGQITGGQTLTFTNSQGSPGLPVILFLSGVNGIPFSLRLINGFMDASGEWCLSAGTPAALMGAQLQFVTFGFVTPSTLGASNMAVVDFL